ncbi:hypothetical protein V5799_034051 [Amblyomma americanum]|uniref:Uncharacterized protein n=1 Tax=Amblyomma americanum TaxID=6943 RepID=A0AAQ4DLJ8_AMBAM
MAGFGAFHPQPVCQWVQCHGSRLPSNAVPGGEDCGESIFIGRAMHGGDLVPGKVVPSHDCCYVSYDGTEHSHQEYQSEAPAPGYNAENTGQHQALVVIRIDDVYDKGHFHMLLVYENADLGLQCLPTDAILDGAHHLAPHGVPVTKAKEVVAEAGNILEVQRDLVQAAAEALVLPVHNDVIEHGAFTPSGLHGVREDGEEIEHLLLALA